MTEQLINEAKEAADFTMQVMQIAGQVVYAVSNSDEPHVMLMILDPSSLAAGGKKSAKVFAGPVPPGLLGRTNALYSEYMDLWNKAHGLDVAPVEGKG